MPRFALPALVLALCATAANADEPVSFGNEVMAVLARAGCNQGVCHGNLNGKGGFKLSLRGEDPAADFATLTRDALARRTDAFARKALETVPNDAAPEVRVFAAALL